MAPENCLVVEDSIIGLKVFATQFSSPIELSILHGPFLQASMQFLKFLVVELQKLISEVETLSLLLSFY